VQDLHSLDQASILALTSELRVRLADLESLEGLVGTAHSDVFKAAILQRGAREQIQNEMVATRLHTFEHIA